MQHNTWGKDRNDLASLAGSVLNESHGQIDSTVGEFDEFLGKAEKFVDEIGDDGLEFLINLGMHQVETLMQVVKDEYDYRNAPRDY